MFLNISKKQLFSFIWWKLPQYHDFHIFVAHGAIRTGKTVFVAYSFFEWAEETVLNTPPNAHTQGWNKFNIVGATKYTAEDNVVDPILQYAQSKKGYFEVRMRTHLAAYDKAYFIDRGAGVIIFKNKRKYFTFKYLGINNKRSVISIQGGTRRGTMIDEAALIPVNLIEQAVGRNITFKDYKVFMTGNPEGDDSHPFYLQYIKGGREKGILVIQYELLDNPIFTQSEVDRMRKIFTPIMFQRKVLGLWVRDSGSIYKKFSYERHVANFYKDVNNSTYSHLNVGIDYGEVDATVFTLTGVKKRMMGLDVISAYYHKNDDYSEKDINDYVDDFFTWIEPLHEKFKRTFKIFVESASNGVTFFKLLRKRAEEKGYRWLHFRLVNKTKRMHTSKSAIKERIDALNLMLGADFIRIERAAKELVLAIKKAVYDDDKEERLDDGTTDIDSLDSLEYSFVHLIPEIIKRIEFLRG